jgi:zinc/manganese transport system ATP-binding protein
MSHLLELRGVTVSYGGAPVLDRIDLTLEEGSYYGIVGPSGAGKTTLLRTILGSLRPLAGEVRVAGRHIEPGRRSTVGYVPQVETVDWNFPVSVREVVAMGLPSRRWPRLSKGDRRAICELLDQLGLSGFERRHIRALSGGQQQRVFLARALIGHPPLLVLDEPTSGVDVATKRAILDLLGELNSQGTGVILTTHDLNSVASSLPGLVCLNGGVVAVGRPKEIFDPDILRRTFGAEMAIVEHEGHLFAVEVPEVSPVAASGHEHHVHVHHEHEPADEEASA